MIFKRAKIESRPILIFSKNRGNLISEALTVKGLKTQIENKDIQETNEDLNRFSSIVIDFETIQDLKAILRNLSRILPKGIPSIALADNDSIKISQEFLKNGIKYLHFDTQLQTLFDEVYNNEENNNHPDGVQISVLGTKGGVGASFIAYNLANIIFNRYKTKTLLVQKIGGSFNIDLFSNKNFTSEYFNDDELYLLRENSDFTYNPKRYNFIIQDECISGYNKENIETMLNESDCIVIVINSEFTSIKKAKEVIEINNFLLKVNQGCTNLAIVKNENSMINTLNNVEISEILGKKDIISVPFSKGIKEIELKPNQKSLKSIEHIAKKIIGGDFEKQKFLGIFKL